MTHMDIFATRFADLADSVGTDATDFGTTVNRERKTIYRWRNGKGYPTVTALIRICEKYGVSADWLLGIESGETV